MMIAMVWDELQRAKAAMNRLNFEGEHGAPAYLYEAFNALEDAIALAMSPAPQEPAEPPPDAGIQGAVELIGKEISRRMVERLDPVIEADKGATEATVARLDSIEGALRALGNVVEQMATRLGMTPDPAVGPNVQRGPCGGPLGGRLFDAVAKRDAPASREAFLATVEKRQAEIEHTRRKQAALAAAYAAEASECPVTLDQLLGL